MTGQECAAGRFRSGEQPSRGRELARVLDGAAQDLISRGEDESVDYTLRLIVSGAIAAIPDVDRAGISYVQLDRTVTSEAPSDDVVAELDVLQNELREGPCRDAIRDQERVLVEDMSAGARRWPRFAPVARERGVATMCSFRLFTTGDGAAGALNLYSGTPGAFGDDSLDTGALFASHAAIALHGAQRVAGLSWALRSRDVIGQAKGILIERFTLSEGRAFAMLVRSSQETNLKLHAVAEWLVDEATRGREGPPTPGSS